jgi:hypothetical protein
MAFNTLKEKLIVKNLNCMILNEVIKIVKHFIESGE